MPHSDLPEGRAKVHIECFKRSKGPDKKIFQFPVPKLTLGQQMQTFDRSEAQKLWELALCEHREYEGMHEDKGRKNAGCETDSFLGLPGEIRNIIYSFYLGSAKNPLSKNGECVKPGLSKVDHSSLPHFVAASGKKTRPSKPVRKNEREMRRLMVLKGNEFVETYKLSYNAKDAFLDRIAAHTIDLKDETEAEKEYTPGTVRINERGQLCERLPALALTCRKILGEMWGLCFSPEKHNRRRVPKSTSRARWLTSCWKTMPERRPPAEQSTPRLGS